MKLFVFPKINLPLTLSVDLKSSSHPDMIWMDQFSFQQNVIQDVTGIIDSVNRGRK